MGVVGKNEAEFGTARHAGLGKGSRDSAINQPRQACLIGPIACFD